MSQELEFAVVPPRPILTSRWTEAVRCYQCGRLLRPGAKGPVTKDARGVRHGTASGACSAAKKAEEGSDVLIAMLAVSVKQGPT